MSNSDHPLQPLLGPLRFACARDFANLGQVKGLAAPLAAAIERAANLPHHVVGALRRELPRVDDADLSVRKASVLALVGVLASQGLDPLGSAPRPSAPPAQQAAPPHSPSDAATTRAVPRPTAAMQPTAASGALPRQGPAATASARKTRQAAPSAPAGPLEAAPPDDAVPGKAEKPAKRTRAAPKTKAAAPRKPRAGKKPPVEEEAPARVLSIAPRSGPLSAPLKSLGFRLNPRLVGHLNKRGVSKVGDVLFLLPRAYEDRRSLSRIAQLRAGERGTIIATVRAIDEARGGGRRSFRAVLADETGSIAAVHYQTGPWLKAKYPVGKRLVVSGEVRQSNRGWEMPHPEVESADDVESSPIHFNRVVPIYPGFERHEQRSLRELTYRVAESSALAIDEPLPADLRERHGLLGLGEALRAIHYPGAGVSLQALNDHQSDAHRRLAFDELFFLQLGMALRRQGVKVQPGIAFDASPARLEEAGRVVPFTLTNAQARVVKQVAEDMARPEPMNRLLQGDVGSGKTAVAMIASAVAVANGYQVAVMTPTELLSEQHTRTFGQAFAASGVEVALITGSGTAKTKAAARAAVASGAAQIVVGTHALIEDGVDFEKLGLVIIDEQHRFGVIQRHALMDKGVRPDVLVMTATPIPRTLAMTLYGDLDVSVIDELPPGRTPIETRVFHEKVRPKAWAALAEELAQGHQAYVVYPLVEESEKVDLSDATQGLADVQAAFPQARVGLLHGRMKADEKEAVMSAFRAHEVDVLVCTTVVEVGVDVPNASVMVIEHAEQFGLSQLHQLRGRVGRGAAKSHCFLMTGYALSEDARQRLSVMEQSTDGFVIAERDLEIRGPGEFLGTRQSGLPELAVANLARDQAILALAQAEARAVVRDDPQLAQPRHQPLAIALEERWEGRLKLARVG